jgi:penicillin-binding protein 1C
VIAALLLPALPQKLISPPWSRALFASNGELLDVQIASDEQWRLPPPAALPKKYVAAVLAFEDRQFFRHPGINPVAILHAAASNLQAGKIKRGASTITMQLARLALDNPPRTYGNKLREVWLALQLEARYDKNDILGLYAVHAPFGGNIVGLTAASWHYFARAPDELSWAEAALLAVLPNSPSLLHPGRNRDALQRKRDRLLSYLHDTGTLTDSDYRVALLESLPQRAQSWPALAPHLLQRMIAGAPQQASFDTTIEADRQQDFMQLVQRHGRALAQEGVHNIALVAVDHQHMTVVAYIGNHATANPAMANPAADNVPGDGASAPPAATSSSGVSIQNRHGADVDIARSTRSTGSVLKPLLYGLMLQEGELLPTTLVPDIPTTFGSYSPENYDHEFRGAVPVQNALAQSLNVPAVRLLNSYGVERFRERLQAFGLSSITRSAENYGLSLILGGAEASLWELTAAYANLTRIAEQNSYPALRRDVSLLKDRVPADATSNFPLQSGAAWLTLQVMINAVRPGADTFWRDFEDSQIIAWKTGTSYGLRDGWAIGSNGRYTVGVWTGNADGAPAASLGGAYSAGPILMDAFALLGNSAWIQRPANTLKSVKVCADDGFLATDACTATTATAPADSTFTRTSPHHPRIFLSPDGKYRVHSGCESPARMQVRDWFVLPPAQEYFWKKQHSEYLPLPPWRSDCIKTLQQNAGELAFELIYPDSENTLYLPLDLDGKLGHAVFRAVHRDAQATLHWHLDGEYLGQTQLFHEKAMHAAPGDHLLVLVDQNGQRLERKFSVVNPAR